MTMTDGGGDRVDPYRIHRKRKVTDCMKRTKHRRKGRQTTNRHASIRLKTFATSLVSTHQVYCMACLDQCKDNFLDSYVPGIVSIPDLADPHCLTTALAHALAHS